MIERKDVEKLAALARITIPENEIEKVRTDIDAILAYVDQIKEANDLAAGNMGDNKTRLFRLVFTTMLLL